MGLKAVGGGDYTTKIGGVKFDDGQNGDKDLTNFVNLSTVQLY